MLHRAHQLPHMLDSLKEQAEVIKAPSQVENGQLKDHPCYDQLLTAYHPKGDSKEAMNTFLAPSLFEQSDEMRNHVCGRGRGREQRLLRFSVKDYEAYVRDKLNTRELRIHKEKLLCMNF